MKLVRHLLPGILALLLTAASFAKAQGHMQCMQHDQETMAVASAESVAASKVEYRCPMHPDVVSDKPGKCPKCGMALQKVTNQAASSESMKHSAKDKAGAPSKMKGADSTKVQQHNHDNM